MKKIYGKCNDIVINLIPKKESEKYPPKLFVLLNDV